MAAADSHCGGSPRLVTCILPVDPSNVASADLSSSVIPLLQDWSLDPRNASADAANLRRAAKELRETDVPVAFPTETVYGLGADVTRSSAVQGIFRAKKRPSDNPLIVHISSLQQLRYLLDPKIDNSSRKHAEFGRGGHQAPSPLRVQDTPLDQHKADPIPVIYQPLIQKFWPGPLTLIMPNPKPSILAPEVTAGLLTFGVRMPRNLVALTLIDIAGVPLAAPSANASSKPSPTTAAHVKHDLDGRISTIIDGGRCDVGVESTVVDGLSDPPLVLRPGGIGIDQLRSCPGWENVKIGYQDASEAGSKPKAPGMKYKHYSPKARVVLYEYSQPQPSLRDIAMHGKRVGLIRTKAWKIPVANVSVPRGSQSQIPVEEREIILDDSPGAGTLNGSCADKSSSFFSNVRRFEIEVDGCQDLLEVWDIGLGSSSNQVARGLFSALRELDGESVDTIFVEGIDDTRGDEAAAVMNRLRKAAEIAPCLL